MAKCWAIDTLLGATKFKKILEGKIYDARLHCPLNEAGMKEGLVEGWKESCYRNAHPSLRWNAVNNEIMRILSLLSIDERTKRFKGTTLFANNLG